MGTNNGRIEGTIKNYASRLGEDFAIAKHRFAKTKPISREIMKGDDYSEGKKRGARQNCKQINRVTRNDCKNMYV